MPRTRVRVCSVVGCPTFSDQPRCPAHRRGTTRERGYDAEHERQRDEAKPLVEAGLVTCWRCGQPILPTDEWHLGHDDHDRSITRGPEHARRCNLAAAGRAAHGNTD